MEEFAELKNSLTNDNLGRKSLEISYIKEENTS